MYGCVCLYACVLGSPACVYIFVSFLFLRLCVQELALKVMDIDLPSEVMVHLLDEMSNTEERLAHGGSERLQLGSLVGAFATARYLNAAT